MSMVIVTEEEVVVEVIEDLVASLMQAQQANLGPLDARLEAALDVAIEARIADILMDRAQEAQQDDKAVDALIDDQAFEREADAAITADQTETEAEDGASVARGREAPTPEAEWDADDAATADGAAAPEVAVGPDPEMNSAAEQAADAVRAQVDAEIGGLLRDMRDEFASHLGDLAMLGQPELDQFMTDLLCGTAEDVMVEASASHLEETAEAASNGLERIADAIEGLYPAAIVDELEANIRDRLCGMMDPVQAREDALYVLGIDAEAGPQGGFEVALASAMADSLLAEQERAALRAVEVDLDALPPNSVAARVGGAMIEIAGGVSAADDVLRAAMKDYYDELVDYAGVEEATGILGRLLDAEQPLIAEALRDSFLTGGFDPRIVDAVSTDAETRAGALDALATPLPELEVRPRSETRLSPYEELLDMPELTAAEVVESARAALKKENSVEDAISFHAEGRMGYAAATLDLLADLVASGAVAPDAEVAVGKAVFQIEQGRQAEDTQAAHRLAGQLYIGVGQAELRDLTQDERAPFRLDALLEDDQAAARARMFAASTQVLPSAVNGVDSALERLGLREGLAEAAHALVDGTAPGPEAAFEVFRQAALEAIDDVRAEAEDKLRGHRELAAEIPGEAGPSILEQALKERIAIAQVYSEAFAVASVETARERMQHYSMDD